MSKKFRNVIIALASASVIFLATTRIEIVTDEDLNRQFLDVIGIKYEDLADGIDSPPIEVLEAKYRVNLAGDFTENEIGILDGVLGKVWGRYDLSKVNLVILKSTRLDKYDLGGLAKTNVGEYDVVVLDDEKNIEYGFGTYLKDYGATGGHEIGHILIRRDPELWRTLRGRFEEMNTGLEYELVDGRPRGKVSRRCSASEFLNNMREEIIAMKRETKRIIEQLDYPGLGGFSVKDFIEENENLYNEFEQFELELTEKIKSVDNLEEELAETFAYLVLGKTYAYDDPIVREKIEILDEALAERYGK